MQDIPDLVGTLAHRGSGAEKPTLRSRWRTFYDKYEIEFCIGTMVFWVVGGKVSVSDFCSLVVCL